MPLYDYKCECGNKVSIHQEMETKHEYICICGKKMQRIFFAAPFKFSGHPRWYEPKKMDAEYDRRAHLRIKELKGERINDY